MKPQMLTGSGAAAANLRPVIFAYAAANIVVAALLLSTVAPAPSTQAGSHSAGNEIASLR